MLRSMALVRTVVSEELSVSFIRLTRIGELGTTLAVTSNWHHPDEGGAKFLRNVGSYKSHTANILEDAILHSHRRENLKSYKYVYTLWILWENW
jgi:hypothetical protein